MDSEAEPRRASRRAPRKAPITVDGVVDAALQVIAEEGYDSLTVRRVAAVLDTGPASLYAHVANMADLDELIIGRLCREVDLPEPEPSRWREQILGVCAQIRDQYLRYPGVGRAALGMGPANLDALRVNEGMLAILIAAGIEPQAAAWGVDAMSLYVSAYTLERSLVDRRRKPGDEWVAGPEELRRRLRNLPPDDFPHVRRHAVELTAGTGHDRFDFALTLMIDNLADRRAPAT